MRLRIRIDTENEAFSDGNSGSELARILRALADDLEGTEIKGGFAERLRDYNGNTVGRVWSDDGSEAAPSTTRGKGEA